VNKKSTEDGNPVMTPRQIEAVEHFNSHFDKRFSETLFKMMPGREMRVDINIRGGECTPQVIRNIIKWLEVQASVLEDDIEETK